MRKYILVFLFLGILGTMLYSCQSADDVTRDMYYSNGRDIYIQRCQNCHDDKGQGLADLIPPLTDTLYLKINKSKLACIIKNGMQEKIKVDNRVFEEKMPANADFKDIDLAQVIVYITNSNGNKQGMYSTGQVASDLNNCK